MGRGQFKNGTVPILRDGNQWRPFVHVKDVTHAIQLVLKATPEKINGQVFNVGSDDQNWQIMPLAQQLAKELRLPFEYEWYGVPDHRSYRVSFSKIQEVLGFDTEFTPGDGAREIYQELKKGTLNPDDPRSLTVNWYKQMTNNNLYNLDDKF
jgi:nucleoside-diphosphate-sugar epimerase